MTTSHRFAMLHLNETAWLEQSPLDKLDENWLC